MTKWYLAETDAFNINHIDQYDETLPLFGTSIPIERVLIPPKGEYSHVTPENGYYSSCDAWIDDGCPDPPEEPFRVHWNER